MITLVASLLIGVIAGLRAMVAPAAVSWAAHLGWIDLSASSLAFLGYAWTPYVFTVLALVEFVTDQLPSTPSRKVPQQFGARIVSGAFCGAAIGAASGMLVPGLIAGAIGAVLGTLGGAAGRARLSAAFRRDLPAGLVEDVVAIVGAVAIVRAVAA